FSRDALHIARQRADDVPRSVMNRPLAKVALFATLLAASYAALTITGGGPSLASAPSVETATLGSFSTQSAPDGVAQKTSEVVSPQADESTPVATPVKTLQSSIEPQAAPAVTAAETSAEAAKPVPAPIVAAAPTSVPAVSAPVVPVVTPASAPAVVPPAGSSYHTAQEIRAFAAAAGWDAEHLDDVVQVAWCESTNNAAAVGGMGAYGLMQVMPFWFRVAGIDMANWSDPVSNLKVALVAFRTDIAESKAPWSAWDCKPGH
ncbi:MAG: lytic transglycosylase domain-containing protein, partial [Anaerolineaceae bacterium]